MGTGGSRLDRREVVPKRVDEHGAAADRWGVHGIQGDQLRAVP
jgi:hypothetical protein